MSAQSAQYPDGRTPTKVTFGEFVKPQRKARKAKEHKVPTSNPFALLDKSKSNVVVAPVVAPVTPKATKPATAKKSGMTWAEKLELQSVLAEIELIETLETPN